MKCVKKCITQYIKNCFFIICLVLTSLPVHADSIPIGGPPGWPGLSHHWLPALKQAVGTSYERSGAASPVWFTVAEGVMSEVFYPHSDQAQVGYLEFVVTDGEKYFSEQRSGLSHENGVISENNKNSQVSYDGEGMTVHIQGEDKLRFYHFDQYIITDTATPTVRIHTQFKWNTPDGSPSGMRVFVIFKPAVNNSGALNLGTVGPDGLFAGSTSSSVSLALLSSAPWTTTSAGYIGFSDPRQDLFQHFHLTEPWRQVGAGNIALAGEVQVKPGPSFDFDLALGFGSSRVEAQTYASTFLNIPFEQARESYEQSWRSYLNDLQNSPLIPHTTMIESGFTKKSTQIIKIHEDKLKRGAIVASLSKPTIISSDHISDAQEGYHLIWPRDLYYAALGLLAAGDTQTPVDVFHYLRQTQKKDGSWSSPFWIDGTPVGSLPSLQASELASDSSYAILLANQLVKKGVYQLTSEDLEMIRNATSLILSRGPTLEKFQDGSQQYRQADLAFEIAALRAGGFLLQDQESEKAADLWQSSIEKWTLIQNGARGSNYYAQKVTPVSEYLDGGFLQWVHLGIRDASDPRVLNTLKIYDDPTTGITAQSLDIPAGLIFKKDNRPTSEDPIPSGSFFPTLTAERGFYSVSSHQLDQARSALTALEEGSTSTGLLPEQLFLNSGTSTLKVRLGVACPFVWAHSVDILLRRSIEEGSVFDAPTSN